MLNDLEASVSEVIIFENLKRIAERIADLESLDEDRWSTVTYLCNKIGILEKDYRKIEKENKHNIQGNKILIKRISELEEQNIKLLETQKEILNLVKNLKI